MSEEKKTYSVRSGEPLAQVEPEADYYRRQIRSIEHVMNELDAHNTLAGDGPTGVDANAITRFLAELRIVTSEALRRPRSNGDAIDRLERELAELRADLIDYGILKRDYRAAQEKLNLLWRNRGPFERFVRATIGEAAIRIDRWRK